MSETSTRAIEKKRSQAVQLEGSVGEEEEEEETSSREENMPIYHKKK